MFTNSRVFSNFNRPDSSVFDVDRDEEGLGATVQRGDVVSFSYERYSRHAIPTAPSLFRIRHDLTWQDILHDFASYSSHPQALNGMLTPIIFS